MPHAQVAHNPIPFPTTHYRSWADPPLLDNSKQFATDIVLPFLVYCTPAVMGAKYSGPHCQDRISTYLSYELKQTTIACAFDRLA